MTRKLLYAVVCGAGPAAHVDKLVNLAHERNWDVQIIATPSALDFIDVPGLEELTGNRVRSAYRKPGEPRSSPADGVIVAPATYNTINKLAAGISDTYALGVLAEAPGLAIPVVIMPFVNSALAARQPYVQSLRSLSSEGMDVMTGERGIWPHSPGEGEALARVFPWGNGLDRLALLIPPPRVLSDG